MGLLDRMQIAVDAKDDEGWVGRVLLVEDDSDLAKALARSMEKEYYRVTIANSGEMALDELGRDSFDVVLLDIVLPGISGLEVCKTVVGRWPELAIIMITSLGEVDDVVVGLELGADDYLVKPFGLSELSARLHAILRRGDRADSKVSLARLLSPDMVETIGAFTLSFIDKTVIYKNKTMHFRPREFEILRLFLKRPGVILTRNTVETILRNKGSALSDATLDWYVHQLRRKLEAEIGTPLIKTIYSVGWCLDESWRN